MILYYRQIRYTIIICRKYNLRVSFWFIRITVHVTNGFFNWLKVSYWGILSFSHCNLTLYESRFTRNDVENREHFTETATEYRCARNVIVYFLLKKYLYDSPSSVENYGVNLVLESSLLMIKNVHVLLLLLLLREWTWTSLLEHVENSPYTESNRTAAGS